MCFGSLEGFLQDHLKETKKSIPMKDVKKKEMIEKQSYKGSKSSEREQELESTLLEDHR